LNASSRFQSGLQSHHQHTVVGVSWSVIIVVQ
jgi:hypothetical protein